MKDGPGIKLENWRSAQNISTNYIYNTHMLLHVKFDDIDGINLAIILKTKIRTERNDSDRKLQWPIACLSVRYCIKHTVQI